ncbi:MAG TPA: glycosyl hydrolase family 28-related protein, partial [Verrucomicrobiae bacterium]|nr:glycosyl hydrolase family 28-related protein [Verrucomicrobiae bacterium]
MKKFESTRRWFVLGILTVFALGTRTPLLTAAEGSAANGVNQAAGKKAVQVAARAWDQVPQILERIVPPHFPARDFLITKYGAVGDGTTDCTKAFSEAIAACNQAGGGRVVVPAGTFLTG